MKHFFLGAFLALLGLVSTVNAVSAQSVSAVITPCGEYTFETQRIVDGLQIHAVNGRVTKKIFVYRQGIRGSGGPGAIEVLGCQDGKLALSFKTVSRYVTITGIILINPFGQNLAEEAFASVTVNTGAPGYTPTQYEPAGNEAVARMLLEGSRTPLETLSTRAILIAKQRDSAPQAILTDRSFYIFGKNGAIEKRVANSYWGTTNELSVTTCGEVTYRIFQKQFAEKNTKTSAYPMEQFVVARTTSKGTQYLPVAYPDKGWQQERSEANGYHDGTYPVSAMKCIGSGMYLAVKDRLTIVTPTASKIDHLNTDRSIPSSKIYFDGQYYYQAGYVDNVGGVVVADSSIKTLRTDGVVVVTKPVYLQDITKTPDSSIRFYKNPNNPQEVVADLVIAMNNDGSRPYSKTNFTYRNGAYVQDDSWKEKIVGAYPWYENLKKATPMYLQAEPGMIVLKSYHLEKPTLIHQTPGKTPTVEWFVVSALKADGTRDITYAFNVGGARQIWKATVK